VPIGPEVRGVQIRVVHSLKVGVDGVGLVNSERVLIVGIVVPDGPAAFLHDGGITVAGAIVAAHHVADKQAGAGGAVGLGNGVDVRGIQSGDIGSQIGHPCDGPFVVIPVRNLAGGGQTQNGVVGRGVCHRLNDFVTIADKGDLQLRQAIQILVTGVLCAKAQIVRVCILQILAVFILVGLLEFLRMSNKVGEQSQIGGFGAGLFHVQIIDLLAAGIGRNDIPPVVDGSGVGECRGVVKPIGHAGVIRHAVGHHIGVDMGADVGGEVGIQVFTVIFKGNIAQRVGILNYVAEHVAGIHLGDQLGDGLTGVQIVDFHLQFGVFLHEFFSNLGQLAGGAVDNNGGVLFFGLLIQLVCGHRIVRIVRRDGVI